VSGATGPARVEGDNVSRTHPASLGRFALTGAVLLAAACASSVSARVPTAPGGPNYASDLVTCEKATPPGMDQRGERFAGCMVAAGHAAWLQVAAGEEFMIRQTTPHGRQAAMDDLVQCYKTVKTEGALADCLAPRGYAVRRYYPPSR
jgi:hypothetical protein